MTSRHLMEDAERSAEAAELERLARQLRLSKDDLAETFSVALSTVWAWKSGRSTIPLMVLRMRLHHELPPPWNRWRFEGGKLVAFRLRARA